MRTVSQLLGLAAILLCGTNFALADPVNINTADAKTLAEELDGIGPALAAAIIRDREENGPYEAPEDIMRVSGIGERVLENNRENILDKDDESGEE